MDEILANPKVQVLLTALFYFALCGAVFSLLALRWPNIKGQPLLRAGMLTDSIYWFVGPLVYGLVVTLLLVFGMMLVWDIKGDAAVEEFLTHGRPPINDWPLWVQITCILILSDIIQYWIHRGFHHRWAWMYHAVHHSSESVDWLSTSRFHPVNYIVSFSLVSVVMLLMGFAPAAFVLLAPFNAIYSSLVHANLNWTFGPLRYVLASPVFHRWHHTMQEEGKDKNFAPTFPILDVMFGTFYMPKGRLPERFGISDKMPSDIIGQLAYPWQRKR